MNDIFLGCPIGWKEFENSCYQHFGIGCGLWQSALDHCQRWSSHLASIHSSEEQIFIKDFVIRSNITSIFWIGGEKPHGDLPWRWEDQSEFDYTNWASGEPNGEDDNCISMNKAYDYQLGDGNCDSCADGLICKITF